MGVSKNRVFPPKMDGGENHRKPRLKWDDLGEPPLFLETFCTAFKPFHYGG